MARSFLRILALGISAVWLAGCASVTVKNEDVKLDRAPVRAPNKIYVLDFIAHDGRFQIAGKDPGAAEEISIKTANKLSTQLAKHLSTYVMPAEVARAGKLPHSGWLLRGRFDSVRSGSVPLRIAIGLGSGRSTMNTTVYVYDLSKETGRVMKPFLTFETVGGSGATPGLVTIPFTGPVSVPMLIWDVGSKTYGEINHGVDDDLKRTSRMISAALAEYLSRRGFIPQGSPLKAKRDWRSSFDMPRMPLKD